MAHVAAARPDAALQSCALLASKATNRLDEKSATLLFCSGIDPAEFGQVVDLLHTLQSAPVTSLLSIRICLCGCDYHVLQADL